MRRIPSALAATVTVTALCACTNPQPCPSPLEECGGQCVDVQSDRHHCGGCGQLCDPGEACVGAACTADVRAPCPDRLGGAFVTLEHCGASLKLWVTRPEFIAEAPTYLGTTAAPKVPQFAVIGGTDCDTQWSWHVDSATPSFVTTVTATGCDVCPDVLEANALASSGRWCPSQARVLWVEVK